MMPYGQQQADNGIKVRMNVFGVYGHYVQQEEIVGDGHRMARRRGV